MRIFTAITFGASTRQYLLEAAGSISSLYRDAKSVRPANLHMTVVFIGEADRHKVNSAICAARETSKEIKKFEAVIDGISSFRKRNSHTVYCNVVASEELINLHHRMVSDLREHGIDTEFMKYKPHITLARQARLMGNSGYIKLPEHKFEVNEICVMESSRINGLLTYTPLMKYNLGET